MFFTVIWQNFHRKLFSHSFWVILLCCSQPKLLAFISFCKLQLSRGCEVKIYFSILEWKLQHKLWNFFFSSRITEKFFFDFNFFFARRREILTYERTNEREFAMQTCKKIIISLDDSTSTSKDAQTSTIHDRLSR